MLPQVQLVATLVNSCGDCRYVMSNLNISGRRLVTMEDVNQMIDAVDDGDGRLDFSEFIQLIQKRY